MVHTKIIKNYMHQNYKHNLKFNPSSINSIQESCVGASIYFNGK